MKNVSENAANLFYAVNCFILISKSSKNNKRGIFKAVTSYNNQNNGNIVNRHKGFPESFTHIISVLRLHESRNGISDSKSKES